MIAMKMLKRFAVVAGALAMLVAGIGTSSAATSANATVQITVPAGAGLTASIQAANLGSYIYSFTQQTATGTLTLGALDNRGTAAGWHISLSAQSANFVGSGSASHTIPVSGLSIVSNGGITTNSGNSNVSGQSRPGVASVSTVTPATAWSAAVGSGDGDYTLASTANLTIPAGTLVDSYSVTLEVGINSGP